MVPATQSCSHIRVFSRKESREVNPGALPHLREIRELLFAGKYDEAHALCRDTCPDTAGRVDQPRHFFLAQHRRQVLVALGKWNLIGQVGKQIGWHSFRHSLATNLRAPNDARHLHSSCTPTEAGCEQESY
jgi:hypothetical protein